MLLVHKRQQVANAIAPEYRSLADKLRKQAIFDFTLLTAKVTYEVIDIGLDVAAFYVLQGSSEHDDIFAPYLAMLIVATIASLINLFFVMRVLLGLWTELKEGVDVAAYARNAMANLDATYTLTKEDAPVRLSKVCERRLGESNVG